MTAEQVARVKPDPELHEKALRILGIACSEAIAVEDSPNGVVVARAAGLCCVAVPGPMTKGLDFEEASLILGSLAERTVADVVSELSAL